MTVKIARLLVFALAILASGISAFPPQDQTMFYGCLERSAQEKNYQQTVNSPVDERLVASTGFALYFNPIFTPFYRLAIPIDLLIGYEYTGADKQVLVENSSENLTHYYNCNYLAGGLLLNTLHFANVACFGGLGLSNDHLTHVLAGNEQDYSATHLQFFIMPGLEFFYGIRNTGIHIKLGLYLKKEFVKTWKIDAPSLGGYDLVDHSSGQIVARLAVGFGRKARTVEEKPARTMASPGPGQTAEKPTPVAQSTSVLRQNKNEADTEKIIQPQRNSADSLPVPQMKAASEEKSRVAPGTAREDSAASSAVEQEKALRQSDMVDSAGASSNHNNKTSAGIVRVSVLPLRSSSVDPSLLMVLADDFRKALAATGKFSVMSRELMKEVIEEQQFQMSDVCDSATCMAQAGKVMGVSYIIATTITAMPGNTYVVSTKMVDVSTGKIAQTASESHAGGLYETTTRILTNLATVLAGNPNQDHLDYVKEQEKLLREKQSAETWISHRFRFGIEGSGFYQFNVLEPDAEAKKRAYFATDRHLASYEASKNSVDPAVMFTAAYRFHDRLWVHLFGGYSQTRVRESGAVDTFFLDSTIPSGTDTSRFLGKGYDLGKTYLSYDMIDVGIGLDADLFRTARMKIVLSLTPMAGWTFLNMTTYDSTRTDAAIFQNGMQLGKYEYFEQDIGKGTLSSFSLGAKAALNAEYAITKNWVIFGGIDLSWKSVLSLWGTLDMKQHTVTATALGTVTSDSAWQEHRAAMRGDFLGTGEYVEITNPDAHQTTPDGKPVEAWRTFKELADFRFGIGIAFYY
jgi:curli biogenesis system outer membrane secretion channel CsgG